MCVHGVREFGESLKPLIKDDGLGSYCSTSGVFCLFEGAEYQFALLLGLISEEQSHVTFQELGQPVGMGFEAGLLVSSQGNSKHSVLAHHELAVRQLLFKPLEIVSRHVVE